MTDEKTECAMVACNYEGEPLVGNTRIVYVPPGHGFAEQILVQILVDSAETEDGWKTLPEKEAAEIMVEYFVILMIKQGREIIKIHKAVDRARSKLSTNIFGKKGGRYEC